MDISDFDPPAPVRRALFHALPDIETAAVNWSPLHGGRTNKSWRLDIGGRDSVVVKLFARALANPLFPNDPNSEARVLKTLSHRGFTPDLLSVFDTELGPCVAYGHIPGKVWASGTSDVGDLMRRLHTTDPTGPFRDIDTTPDHLAAQAFEFAARAGLNRSNLPTLPSNPQRTPISPVFLHGDIVAGNLIRSPSGLVLIDWQCPGLGDPCHDISIFLSPAMMHLYRGAPLDTAEIDGFFAGYASDRVRSRYQTLAPWLHLRMTAYCLWKAQQGNPDYRAAARLELAALEIALAGQSC